MKEPIRKEEGKEEGKEEDKEEDKGTGALVEMIIETTTTMETGGQEDPTTISTVAVAVALSTVAEAVALLPSSWKTH